MYNKTCILCGKDFKCKSNNILICKDDHYVKCDYCNKEFKLSIKQRNTAISKFPKLEFYCCRSCVAKAKANEIHTKESEEKRVKNRLDKNNSQYHNLEKVKQNNLDKYGVEWSWQREDVQQKTKKTLLEKYGVDSPWKSEEIKNKRKENWVKKYGVDNPWKNKDIRNKCISTAIKLYGSPNNIEKQKETNQRRYGSKYLMQNEELKQKAINSCLEKYGVEYNCLTDNCINAQNLTISQHNILMKNKLKENNIDSDLEFIVNLKRYDLHILNTNILLEINPTYTHNSTIGPYFKGKYKEPINNNYHYDKTINAKENGYHCIHIFDWDDKEKIINILKSKQKIYARNCKIKEISPKDSYDFLNKYHLQNAIKSRIKIGLYYNNELVEIMTFGKPRYNKNYEYELLRLCTKSNYEVIGGSEKLFKYFINNYKPNSIISYCDNSKFSGNVYNKLGFKLKSYGKPNKHWYNVKTRKHITNNLLLQQGFDRLFNTNYGKGTNNEELMLKAGFVEIYDCGQSTYIWNRLK